MIFVKEKLRESCTKVCDYEEFKNDIIVWLGLLYVEELHILRLDFNNTVFIYLGYTNASILDTNSYYHIVTSNKDDYDKVIGLIQSKLLKNYVNIKDVTLINYIEELYPELEDNGKLDILSNFNDKLNTFDKAVDYNWKYLNISEREQLVKYTLGIDYHRDDEILSNKTYNEIRRKNKMIDLDRLEQKRREEAHILTPKIESIYANKEKGTIVIKWQTGETTKVTCHESDTWDLEKGIMACITKYVLGNNYNAYSMLDKYIKSVKYSGKDCCAPKSVIE